MVSLEDAIVARLETHGETFEVLLDPKAIDMIRQGKDIDLTEYMAVEDIFKNAGKGTHQTEDKVKEAFGTTDVGDIVKRITEKGDIQVTSEQRKEMLESKKMRIISYIARNAVNPQTRTPHPPKRIELALEEAKFRVDPFRSVDTQVNEAMSALRPLMPIRFEKSKIAVRLKGDDYAKCYDELVNSGTVEREEWQPDGSWIGVMEIPAGIIDELTAKLNNRTRGNASVKLI